MSFDLFQPHPEESPEGDSDLNLFSMPLGVQRPSEALQQPQAQPEPSIPTPTPPSAPAPSPTPRRPRRERDSFEGEDLWQQFLDEKHEGGRELVEHPDPVKRRRRRNHREPRVRFNTAMNYEEYRSVVGREFEAWKQQRPSDEGRPLTSTQGLQEGEILRTPNGFQVKVQRVTPDGSLKYHWKKEDGAWSQRTRQMNLTYFRNRSFTKSEVGESTEKLRAQVGDQIEHLSQLRVGDFIVYGKIEDVPVDSQVVLKVLDLLSDGTVNLQGFERASGDLVGSHVIPGEDLIRSVSRLGQSQGPPSRVEFDPSEQQERAQREREEREREEREREEREREEREQGVLPHIPIGDTLKQPRQLRVGDLFSNRHLRGQGQYREVTKITSDGKVFTQLVEAQSLVRHSPKELTAELFTEYGPYTRFRPPSNRVYSPTDVDPGSYVQKGEQVYRVVHRTPATLYLQDTKNGVGVGRPIKIPKLDLEGGAYEKITTPKQAETGHRVQDFSDMRAGQILSARHHRTPQWVRVESVGSTVKLQAVNSETGEPEGEPEEFSPTDIKRWAYITKMSDLPEVFLPSLETPPHGFAEPGSGELVSNSQSDRYDDVRLSSDVSDATLSHYLGSIAEGKDPKQVAADLVGAGGLAKSLTGLRIYLSGDTLTVEGTGKHIVGMTRKIHMRGGEPDYIYNSYFKLAPSAPKGMGLRMFATQVAAARDAGFKFLKVQAAGSGPWRDEQFNGYYVWPRFGYDGEVGNYLFERMSDSVKKEVKKIRSTAPVDLRFLDLMEAGQETRDWWKDHGVEEDLKFNLTPNSRNLNYLTDYVQKVAKKNANLGADHFLNRAASKKKEDSAKYEDYPDFGPEEEAISNEIWDRMGDETRKRVQQELKIKKQATRNLVKLATDNHTFRGLLLTELKGNS